MSLIACKECLKKISSEAENCPHCGYKNKKSIRWGLLVLVALIGMIIVSIKNYQSIQQKQITANSINYDALKSVTPIPIAQDWIYESNIDSVSGQTIQTATLQSNNTHELDFPYHGGTVGFIKIRYHPRHGKDLIFKVNKGHLNCEYDNCYISARFNEDKVKRIKVSEAADNSNETYFFSNFKKHVNEIKVSKKLYIEVTFYRQGSRTFEFDIDGLDTVKLVLLK